MNNLHKSLILFLLLALASYPVTTVDSIRESETRTIEVEVKGEVGTPGIYTVDAYSTVNDLIGQLQLTDEADLSNVNTTVILKNHDVVVIPEKNSSVLQVSINYGTKEELMMISGIGKVTAQNIIDYRNEHGLFQSIDDLIKVKGIGEKTLAKSREFLIL